MIEQVLWRGTSKYSAAVKAGRDFAYGVLLVPAEVLRAFGELEAPHRFSLQVTTECFVRRFLRIRSKVAISAKAAGTDNIINILFLDEAVTMNVTSVVPTSKSR